jgi:hypothetical protein
LNGNSMMMIPIVLVILAMLVGVALGRHRNSGRHEHVEPVRTDPSRASTENEGRHGGD